MRRGELPTCRTAPPAYVTPDEPSPTLVSNERELSRALRLLQKVDDV